MTTQTQEQITSVNSVHISEICGRLGANPEVRSTTNGKTYTQFVIAQNEDYGNQTNWITVIAWSNEYDKNVCTATQKLRKGSLVRIKDFRLTANAWTDTRPDAPAENKGKVFVRMEAHINCNRQIRFMATAG